MGIKTLDFATAASQNSAPNTVATQASQFPSYATTAAFVTAKGTAAEDGDIFYNSASDRINYYNGSWIELELVKTNATGSDPTTGDDAADGYRLGSVWINTTSDYVFVCADTTNGAAVWQKVPKTTDVPAEVQVAFIKDIRSSGTNGGTFNSGSFVTRTLNTTEGDTGIINSLSSNQFQLPSGEFVLESWSVAVDVGDHQSRIANVTDSTYVYGINTLTASSSPVTGSTSYAAQKVTLASAKTFEIQHRCSATSSGTYGLGEAASFGNSEVYCVVKITKIS